MNVLLFGATGMVGQGVLRECFSDPGVKAVVTVGRTATGQRHQKLKEVVSTDLMDLSKFSSQLTGFDACFFCLGVSALGMTEEQYSRVTYDLTLSVAQTLGRLNPNMTFIYVSGQGTDSTERGRVMWARVKGKTENALLALPIKTYMFRPGAIIPLHGIRSRTRWYNAMYSIARPLFPVLKKIFPDSVTTTEQLGKAMIAVARSGSSARVLETPDINKR
ncbi:MAG: NAD-dependent epimerase/dehydratase family protein [Gemmatimonadota bacterium]|nr:NAD-dependent epimerase/dehydratase family protein [Gemmatimonadota bacterium]